MRYDVGLDVSVKLAAVCIVDDNGEIVREAVVRTGPEDVAALLHGTGLTFTRTGPEAGPLSSWLHDGQKAAGLPAVCVEARPGSTPSASGRSRSPRASSSCASASRCRCQAPAPTGRS